MAGEFLPPQLIYQGKTLRCLPCVKFPDESHVTYSINHWSNEDTMKEYVEYILLPYIDGKWKSLNLADNFSALVLFNNFRAQCTTAVLTLLDLNNINVVLIPPNCILTACNPWMSVSIRPQKITCVGCFNHGMLEK